MSRILFFIFLAFLFWLVIRLLAAQRKRRQEKADRPAEPTTPRAVETMNQCAWCGAHVPAPDALTIADGRVYCSGAHRDAALAAPESPKDS